MKIWRYLPNTLPENKDFIMWRVILTNNPLHTLRRHHHFCGIPITILTSSVIMFMPWALLTGTTALSPVWIRGCTFAWTMWTSTGASCRAMICIVTLMLTVIVSVVVAWFRTKIISLLLVGFGIICDWCDGISNSTIIPTLTRVSNILWIHCMYTWKQRVYKW